jgi:mono/diheme cytochrome c family protein
LALNAIAFGANSGWKRLKGPKMVISVRNNARKRLRVVMISLGVVAIAACTATQRGASDASVANANAKASDGGKLFGQQCASCHGQRGEGLTAPAIMGPGALPVYAKESSLARNPAFTDPSELALRENARPAGAPKREPFNTAKDLYSYVSQRMPMKSAGSLRPDDYWAILNFMLVAHGTSVPAGGINASNAGTVSIVSQ